MNHSHTIGLLTGFAVGAIVMLLVIVIWAI
jgi:hypothetical protein